MIWPYVISAAGVIIAAFAALRTEHWRRNTIDHEKEGRIHDRIDQAHSRTEALEAEQTRIRERIKHMPSQNQIRALTQQIGDLAAEVKGLHAGLNAQNGALGSVRDSVARIENYLLSQSGRGQ